MVRDKAHAAQNPYCQYDSQLLQLWTSTMFIAGAVAGLQLHLLQCVLACSRSLLCSHMHLLSRFTLKIKLLLLMMCTVTAGLIAALVTRRYGRRLTMVVGKLMRVCCPSHICCLLWGAAHIIEPCWMLLQAAWRFSLELAFWLELCTLACSSSGGCSWASVSDLPTRWLPDCAVV